MGGIQKPSPCYLDSCVKVGVYSGRIVYKNIDGNRFYTWDSLHGEIEVFNKSGNHIMVIDATTGKMIKKAIKKRRIPKQN